MNVSHTLFSEFAKGDATPYTNRLNDESLGTNPDNMNRRIKTGGALKNTWGGAMDRLGAMRRRELPTAAGAAKTQRLKAGLSEETQAKTVGLQDRNREARLEEADTARKDRARNKLFASASDAPLPGGRAQQQEIRSHMGQERGRIGSVFDSAKKVGGAALDAMGNAQNRTAPAPEEQNGQTRQTRSERDVAREAAGERAATSGGLATNVPLGVATLGLSNVVGGLWNQRERSKGREDLASLNTNVQTSNDVLDDYFNLQNSRLLIRKIGSTEAIRLGYR